MAHGTAGGTVERMISNSYQFKEDQRLYVPYGPGKGSNTTNIGFIDLKGQPERMAEIHELRGFPVFEELMRALNAPESSVRTLRIDTAKDEFPRDEYPHSFFSMLTFCFEVCQGEEDKGYYIELYRFFVQVASTLLPGDDVQVDFHLVPLTVRPEDYSGWALEIRLYGYGKSEDGARRAWVRGFRQVNEFMLRIEAENRRRP